MSKNKRLTETQKDLIKAAAAVTFVGVVFATGVVAFNYKVWDGYDRPRLFPDNPTKLPTLKYLFQI